MLSEINILHCRHKELEQRRTKVAFAMQLLWLVKSMSWDEMTLVIKPVALSIVELCLAEGISKSVS